MTFTTDVGVIIAIAAGSIAMIGVMISMMFWFRQEANALRAEAKEDRKDILNLIRAIESEMKDFHYRLIEVEKDKK